MKRNNKWVIYTSSYDRGLEHLLKMWADVKKEVKDSELHIFYGWDLFVKFYQNNPSSMAWKKKMDELMKQDGVIDHGRVKQDEIKEWYQKCGIWAYPTHFGEISCISAMKAQAWGSIPVVINYAALKTTVKYGKKIDGDIYEKETISKFKRNLINSLKDEVWQNAIRKKMMEWAKKEYGWDKVAKQWTDEFKKDELKEAMDVILKKDPNLEKYMPLKLQEKYGLPYSY